MRKGQIVQERLTTPKRRGTYRLKKWEQFWEKGKEVAKKTWRNGETKTPVRSSNETDKIGGGDVQKNKM